MKQLLLSISLTTISLFCFENKSDAQCISALELDGVDDYLHSPFSNYNFNNFTIEMWINSPDYLPNEIYAVINQNSYLALGSWQADGSFNTRLDGTSPFTTNSGTGTAPSTGFWHHVAYVFDGTSQIIYIDGLPASTVATNGTPTQGNGNNFGLTLGARFDQSQQWANVTFEDVRIWQIARSQSDIAATYSTNLTGSESGLIAYYRFEDGIGSSTVTDLSGNGNDLTLYNMDPSTDWVSGLFSQDAQGTDIVSNCGPYTWIDGNNYTVDNNSATYTIPGGAVGGCDSIVTLDLTINTPVDLTVAVGMNDLTANHAGADYQWIDCNNGNTPIQGETNQSFTPTSNGSYAVIVTDPNGCRDTTACTSTLTNSLNESVLGELFSISPNPTTGSFTISSLNYSGNIAIEVLDITGKSIYENSNNFNGTSATTIDLKQAPKGVYFVGIQWEDERITKKLIKQ